MKRLLFSLFFLLFCITGFTQTVKRDSSGNYVAARTAKASGAKPSGKTYTDSKGNVYPIYISRNGKLFVKKVSKKTGREYNYYLKINE